VSPKACLLWSCLLTNAFLGERLLAGVRRKRCHAIRRALLLGCSRRSFSIYSCNSPAMFFLASSKLLPSTVSDRLVHSPCQPSSCDQKSQAIGMVAITSRVTTSEVIIHHPTPSLAVRVDHHNSLKTFSPSSRQCQPRSMLRAVSPQGILAIVSIKSSYREASSPHCCGRSLLSFSILRRSCRGTSYESGQF